MPVATVVQREVINPGLYGGLNLRVANPAGITPGLPLTIAGDLVLIAVHEMPNNEFRCEVTRPEFPAKTRAIIRTGNSVTG
jgi:hypothetical protein